MEWLSFSEQAAVMMAEIFLLTQASCIAVIVMVRLPRQSPINSAAKASTAVLWLLIGINIWVELPGKLDNWINVLAITMLVGHSIICLAVSKAIQQRSTNPLKSYLLTLTFGLLHPESWPSLSALKRAAGVNKRRRHTSSKPTDEHNPLPESGR